MPDLVRKLVSGRKNRHVENGVNLDLTYVTDRIIIMGWPASGLASLYRNNRYKVRDFLDEKHYPQDDCHYNCPTLTLFLYVASKCKGVYNLVPLSENSYDPVFFRGHVSRFPFPDHHVPPLSLIPLMVSDAKAWLLEDPENVVVIHCKAGLGRSGTFACCLLLALDPSLSGATSLHDASGTEAIQMVSDALLREQGEDSSDFDGSSSPGDASRSTSLSFSRQMSPPRTSISRSRISTDAGRSSFQVEGREETRAEVSDRLKAVFDLHTSKRIKPEKPTKGEERRNPFPLSEQNGEKNPEGILTGDSGVKMDSAADENVKERSPRRVRSVKDFVSMVSGSGRSRSKSSTGTVLARSSSPSRNGGGTSQIYAGLANPSRSSFVPVEPHSLGACPRGMSTDALPLSDTYYEATFEPQSQSQSQSQTENGKPAWLGVDPSDQFRSTRRSSSRNRNRGQSKSPTRNDSSTMDPKITSNDLSRTQEKPRLATKPGVSIPSQRRWVGYFARILIGEDARLTFSSPCGFASPLPRNGSSSDSSDPHRRKIKITRISIERSSAAKALPVRDNLSIQMGHYDDALVQRLETWECQARRRARAFGIHDPGAISPSTEDEDKEIDFNTRQRSASSTSLSAMATRIQSNASSAASSFYRDPQGSGLFHSPSKSPSSSWSLKINPQTEADRARNFHWGDSDSNGKQLVYGDRLVETRREEVHGSDEEKRLKYIFIPGDPGSGSGSDLNDPKTDGSERKEVLLSPQPRRKKSSIFTPRSNETEKQKASNPSLPSVSLVPPTPPPTNAPLGFEPSSPAPTSPRIKNEGSNPTLMIDPDRELMLKILVGRTGATHSLLPDFTAAAWCWIIPSFEEPRELNRPSSEDDEGEKEIDEQGNHREGKEKMGKIKTSSTGFKVKKGSKTVVRLERDELDFRKDVLGVEALEIEWEWIEG